MLVAAYPRLVASLALLLVASCMMLVAMDTAYMTTFLPSRPLFYQPTGVRQDNTTPAHSTTQGNNNSRASNSSDGDSRVSSSNSSSSNSNNIASDSDSEGRNSGSLSLNSGSYDSNSDDHSHNSGSNDSINAQYIVNNFGGNINLTLLADRQRNAPTSELKYILHWNEAYGDKLYAFGLGREPFYTHRCPETRCVTTDDRGLLPVEDFDAIVFHERSLSWADVPDKRRPSQRYVHFIAESAQYIFNDIGSMAGFFNWSLCNKRDADFWRPDGRIIQVKSHPEGIELDEYIRQFGAKNRHLARNKPNFAAWFVSNCHTPARRETFVAEMQKYAHAAIDIYGGCGSAECPRSNATECYKHVEKNYKFYLSFENSVCEDYVTEKYFTLMQYNIIPVTYNGADMSAYGPPHSSINALEYESAAALLKYLEEVGSKEELYASYFWWKEFYQVRNSDSDKAQAFCELCAALHSDLAPKVYTQFYQWWVADSHCYIPGQAA